MARRKAAHQEAPQTLEEAIDLLATYSDILLGIEELSADATASIAAIEAERDRMIAPLERRAKDIFLQLRAWWAVAGDTLTEGKRKSLELAGCQIGVRTTPPSLKLPPKTNSEAAGALLVAAGLAQLCRHKVEVDKPAVLKERLALPRLQELQRESVEKRSLSFSEAMALACRIERALKLSEQLGFRTAQKEEFFVDRAAPKPAAVEEVPVQEAAE